MAVGEATDLDLAGPRSVRPGSRLAARQHDLVSAISSDGPLERLTVNMIGCAADALNLVVHLTGDTKTDAVNRALQFYAYAELVMARGGTIYVQHSSHAGPEPLRFS